MTSLLTRKLSAPELAGGELRNADELRAAVRHLAELQAALAASLERIEGMLGSAGHGEGSQGQRAITLSASPVGEPPVLEREGDAWAVRFGGKVVRLRDSKGLRYLAELLSHPGVELHALQLARGATKALSTGAPDAVVNGNGISPRANGDAGELLDREAKVAYRLRLDDLRSELEEAERFCDPERAAKARWEIEFLTAELASAVGLGGRDRRAASDCERCRSAVTHAIRSAIHRLVERFPEAGSYLERAVRTGTYCCCDPDRVVPIQPLRRSQDRGAFRVAV